MVIEAKNGRIFQKEKIFFKFETIFGCYATMKAIFPNEDKKAERLQKEKEEAEKRGFTISNKAKLRELIQLQISKLNSDSYLHK